MPDATTTTGTLEGALVPQQRPLGGAGGTDPSCPAWCTDPHAPDSTWTAGSHGVELAVVPHSVGRLETEGSCRVEAVLSATDRVVRLSTDGDGCRLTLEAAETLGRGLLEAAALLRQR